MFSDFYTSTFSGLGEKGEQPFSNIPIGRKSTVRALSMFRKIENNSKDMSYQFASLLVCFGRKMAVALFQISRF